MHAFYLGIKVNTLKVSIDLGLELGIPIRDWYLVSGMGIYWDWESRFEILDPDWDWGWDGNGYLNYELGFGIKNGDLELGHGIRD